jgi:DNA-binding protein H-NS
MTNITDLLAQKEAIEQQIKDLRKNEREGAIAKAREIIAEFDLTADDLFAKGAKAAKGTRGKAAPKYIDPATGKTWTGRGKPPLWIAGKNKDDYLIK